MLQVPRHRAAPGDAAVSEIPKAGGRVALMVASGSTMWTFAVDHVYRSGDVGATLPPLKDAAKEALETTPVYERRKVVSLSFATWNQLDV